MKKICMIMSFALALPILANAQGNTLPTKFKEADIDDNGIISIPEVREMIDGFFIGRHNQGVMYIHDLIDYYFEQS
jgi:hypothetical protein